MSSVRYLGHMPSSLCPTARITVAHRHAVYAAQDYAHHVRARHAGVDNAWSAEADRLGALANAAEADFQDVLSRALTA